MKWKATFVLRNVRGKSEREKNELARRTSNLKESHFLKDIRSCDQINFKKTLFSTIKNDEVEEEDCFRISKHP